MARANGFPSVRVLLRSPVDAMERWMTYKTSERQDELVVITRAFDLAREMTQRTRKLPRDLKFVLGDRMLATAYDVLDTLIEAKYARAKKALLQRANLLLERLRFQVRLCVEEKLISIRQYEYVTEIINEVGRMVGGWAKQAPL